MFSFSGTDDANPDYSRSFESQDRNVLRRALLDIADRWDHWTSQETSKIKELVQEMHPSAPIVQSLTKKAPNKVKCLASKDF